MPNWCYTQVCFKGKPEDIKRLQNDIELANEYAHRNPNWCNIRYFLSLNNFDTVSYVQCFKQYAGVTLDCNFRGNVFSTALAPEECGEYLLYYPAFETAWYMDYQLLQLISMMYNVEYSAYSEESSMGIYEKGGNGNIDTYDFDYVICPDYEQLEEAYNNDPSFEMDYYMPVKIGEPDTDKILDTLKDHGIEFDTIDIDPAPISIPHGVYYHYMYGVIYDDDLHNKIYNYPELDPFNIYVNQ